MTTLDTPAWRVTPARDGRWELRAPNSTVTATFFVEGVAEHYARLMNLRDQHAQEDKK